MGGLLVGVGFLAMIVGMVNIIYPIKKIGVQNRKTASIVLGAGFVMLIFGVAIIPSTPPNNSAAVTTPAGTASATEPAPPTSSTPAASPSAQTSARASTPASTPVPTPSPTTPTTTATAPATSAPAATTSVPTPSPAAVDSESGCLSQAPAPPANAKRVQVKRVIDGDTIELADSTRVRFIGIDTPESVDPRRPVEELGKEASAYTKALIEGKEILIELGLTPVDRYGRTLAWLWMLDGTFINAKLVHDGYAAVYTFSDNPDHAMLLTKCQSEARNAQRGLWAPVAVASTTEALPAQSTETTASTTPTQSVPSPTALAVTRPPGTVAKGSTASVGIHAESGTSCSIEVRYKAGPSGAKGLEAKTTNSNGNASWSWNVGTNTTSGTWPITVTCGTQSVVAELTVP